MKVEKIKKYAIPALIFLFIVIITFFFYKDMVTMLKIKYGLFNISIDYDIKTSIEELGKGRIRAQLKTVI